MIGSFFLHQYMDLINELAFNCRSSAMVRTGFNENLKLNNGKMFNGQLMAIEKATVPGFPFIIDVEPKEGIQVNLVGVMHEKKMNEWVMIPLVHGKKR